MLLICLTYTHQLQRPSCLATICSRIFVFIRAETKLFSLLITFSTHHFNAKKKRLIKLESSIDRKIHANQFDDRLITKVEFQLEMINSGSIFSNIVNANSMMVRMFLFWTIGDLFAIERL